MPITNFGFDSIKIPSNLARQTIKMSQYPAAIMMLMCRVGLLAGSIIMSHKSIKISNFIADYFKLEISERSKQHFQLYK